MQKQKFREVMQFVPNHKLDYTVAEMGIESRCANSPVPAQCIGNGDGNTGARASMGTK